MIKNRLKHTNNKIYFTFTDHFRDLEILLAVNQWKMERHKIADLFAITLIQFV